MSGGENPIKGNRHFKMVEQFKRNIVDQGKQDPKATTLILRAAQVDATLAVAEELAKLNARHAAAETPPVPEYTIELVGRSEMKVGDTVMVPMVVRHVSNDGTLRAVTPDRGSWGGRTPNVPVSAFCTGLGVYRMKEGGQ